MWDYMNVIILFINRIYKIKKLWNKGNSEDGENENFILNKYLFGMFICVFYYLGFRFIF